MRVEVVGHAVPQPRIAEDEVEAVIAQLEAEQVATQQEVPGPVKVHKAVAFEVGVQCDSQQAAFGEAVDSSTVLWTTPFTTRFTLPVLFSSTKKLFRRRNAMPVGSVRPDTTVLAPGWDPP